MVWLLAPMLHAIYYSTQLVLVCMIHYLKRVFVVEGQYIEKPYLCTHAVAYAKWCRSAFIFKLVLNSSCTCSTASSLFLA